MTSAFSSISNVDVCKGVTFFPFDGLREKLRECFREEVRAEMRNVHRAWHLWADGALSARLTRRQAPEAEENSG